MRKRNKNRIKIRKTWGDLDPVTRVHADKAKHPTRNQEKSSWKKQVRAALAESDNFNDL